MGWGTCIFKSKPSYDEILAVATKLRTRDREEIYPLIFNATPEQIAANHFNDGSRPQVDWVVSLLSHPVAILGAVELFPGNWRVYFFATDQCHEVIGHITKFIKTEMIPLLVDIGAHYVDCLSIDGDKKASKWLKSLGAIKEANLNGYGKNKEDYSIYVWRLENVRDTWLKQTEASTNTTSANA